MPRKKSEKILLGQLACKIPAFSGKYVKFRNLNHSVMIVFIVCAVLISAPSTRVIIVCVFASDDVVAYENLMFLSL